MAFPVVLYGYTAHQFLFGIYTGMRAASPKRMITVANKVCLVNRSQLCSMLEHVHHMIQQCQWHARLQHRMIACYAFCSFA